MAKRTLLRGRLKKSTAALILSVLLPLGLSGTTVFAEGESTQQAAPASDAAPPPGAKKAGDEAKQPSGEAAKPASADAKPGDAKSQQPKAMDNGAGPKELKDEAKLSEPANPAVPASPKVTKDGAISADTKPKESGAGAVKPAQARDNAGGAKPKDIAPKLDGSETLAVRASTVNAVYHIHFLGAYIGDFKIRSSITNRQYSLQANADISVFFGTVAWQGVTSSRGLMTANGPVPQNYTFHYSTNDRREAVEIRFQQRMVQDIIINPPAHPGGRSVPITAAHLQNVVDPLSAVVLLSQARLSHRGGEACDKRIPIFDGKIRYDLVLSPKGTRPIANTGRLHGTAYVCKVNYVPIAGHKPGKQGGSDYATGNTGIEIWLVPLQEAGLLVPYYVHVPTPAGTASMVTAKFDVETPGGRHALAD